jgi:hypothetical protein
MQWIFTRKSASTKTRDPISGEYFSSDAIEDAGQALVREAIQNSIDATVPPGPVRIRIFVSGDEHALPSNRHRRWFDGVWPHYAAKNNGLKSGCVTPGMSCRFLVIEDFGTTGLTGDPAQFHELPGVNNQFFYFFRAEGKTGKEGDDLGRWGIGKQVFPRSSLAQTHFGYTETNHGGLLLGSCILKHHQVGGVTYVPDSYFGVQSLADDGEPVAMPITDAAVLAQFRADFHVARQPGERGTSIVVPWLEVAGADDDSERAFERDQLAMSVLEEFLMPILNGRLEVVVVGADGEVPLTAGTYENSLQELSKSTVRSVPQRATRLAPFVDLARRIGAKEYRHHRLNSFPSEKPAWVDGVLPEDMRQIIKADLAAGHVVRVTGAVTVRRKGEMEAGQQQSALSLLDCYLLRNTSEPQQPRFLREGLLISGVRSKAVPGCTSLVLVEKGALATMLGDAENPAHTEWSAKSQNFRDRYRYGSAMLGFVSGFPADLHKAVTTEPARVDRAMLLDLFHDSGPELPQDDGDETEVPPEPIDDADSGDDAGDNDDAGGSTPPPELPKLPRLTTPYRIHDLEDGFTISSTGCGWPADSDMRIRCAYITSKGSALKKYNRVDFDFARTKLQVQLAGATVIKADANLLTLRIHEADFQVKVTGFDKNRDLEVRVDPMSNGADLA